MKYAILLLMMIFSVVQYGQGVDDHRNWSFNRFSFEIDDNYKLHITPIARVNNNLTTFASASIDIGINRPIGQGFTLGVVARSWYFPGRKLRQFIWLDLVHQIPDLGIPFSIKQRLRFHGGLDIYDWVDGDFLRYHIGAIGTFKNSKIQPFFGIEPFFRLNELNYVERFRIEYGFHVKANKNLKFIAIMWQQQMYDFDELYTQYIWTTGIQYFFDNKLIKTPE